MDRKMPARPRNSGDFQRQYAQKNMDDDDALLAAALGSSTDRVEDLDVYEESVIRNAELDSTPRLMMTAAAGVGNDDDNVMLGFPALDAMTPSRNVHADLPHVQTVLQRLRRQGLSSEQECLKEQMLLTLLHSVTGDKDMAVRPQQEAKQELQRKRHYRKQETAPVAKKSGENDNSIKNTEENNGDIHDPSRRLESIKQGNKVVRFAVDIPAAKVLLPSATWMKTIKRRKSMQKRRGLTGEEEDDDGKQKKSKKNRNDCVGALTPEELEELQRRKERLKQWRKEREERRSRRRTATRTKARKRRRLSVEKLRRGRKSKDSDDIEEEVEFEFTGNDDTGQEKKDDSSADQNHGDATTEETISPTAGPSHRVLCPLCQESISVPTVTGELDKAKQQEHQDAVLAEHMSSCQTIRFSRRRNRQSSLMVDASTNASTSSTRQHHDKRPNYVEGTDNENIFDDNSSSSEESEEIDLTSHVEDDTLAVGELDDDDSEIAGIQSSAPKRKQRFVHSSRAALPVDDWDEEDYEDRVEDWIEHGLSEMKSMKEQDANEAPPGEEVYEGGLVVPAWINDRLFPYQRTGLQWMWELHRQQSGGILGDEMGLGKTIQVVSFLGSMAASRKLKSVLIIAPATMLQHWLQELAKWAPGIRRLLIHSSGDSQMGPFLSMGRSNVTSRRLAALDEWLKDCRRNRLFEIIDEDDLETRDPSTFCGTGYAFITTFENVRRNEEIWTGHKWSYVVMDEAQKIRNPNADVTLVCKRLKTPHRLALSGTPIQNDLRELWSIFDFVFPGRLGTLPVFETEFADPIKRGGYANASPMQVQLAYRCALILRDLINPYLLRRLKKDVKEVQRMPGKREQVLFCRLSDQQRDMYEAFLRSDLVKNVFRGSAQLLGAITMLRKICNHPDLVCSPSESSLQAFLQNGFVNENQLVQDAESDANTSNAEFFYDDEETGMKSFVERSGKLEVLAKILPLWHRQGHRVLIFCQWRKMLDLIMRFVEMNGWKYGRLDGNTNVASRQKLVNKFNADDSYFIMLCTTRTGGVGLNLTGANRIILYDPDWNPQTDAQARERAWRFGQEREVTIYRLITAGSVEEKIYQRQIFKTALSNRVLQDPRQRRLFSQKDLKDLFTLKADSGAVLSGGGGMTETSHITKEVGYVDPQEECLNENEKDDGEIMKNVLRSQGLAGVFDHGAVEGNGVNKRQSVREMEDKAKCIAREALQNLSQSVSGHDAFDPESRFGSHMVHTTQSSRLLASIAQRTNEITDSTSVSKSGDMQQYTKLLKDLQDFVRLNIPTTNDILEQFATEVSSFDAAVFRRLLKSLAVLKNGRWRTK